MYLIISEITNVNENICEFLITLAIAIAVLFDGFVSVKYQMYLGAFQQQTRGEKNA